MFNSQTVMEAYEVLHGLVLRGKGDLQLVGFDSNGNSSEIVITSKVYTVDRTEPGGCLVDEELGEKFIVVHID